MMLKETPPNFNMNFKCTVAVFLLMVVLMFATDSTNGFRKPPFNGSIFGKRTISYPEYENPGKTIYTMCEIASDACQNWFPATVEKK
ncbi:FMRFamide-related neuropeptide [Aphis craccivora]|uniref:FMRFamide-related neuropeptide n=2 Tax=Aphis TaxID=464929 RepID=A0A6G0Z7J9_APHCR|nr:FMRFamide-related neuropeptide [Aphis craccivora]